MDRNNAQDADSSFDSDDFNECPDIEKTFEIQDTMHNHALTRINSLAQFSPVTVPNPEIVNSSLKIACK